MATACLRASVRNSPEQALGGLRAHACLLALPARKLPTSRTLGLGAIRSTACASRPATVQASGASVGAAGGRPTPVAIGTPPVPTPTGTPAAAKPAGDMQPAIAPTAGLAVPV